MWRFPDIVQYSLINRRSCTVYDRTLLAGSVNNILGGRAEGQKHINLGLLSQTYMTDNTSTRETRELI